MLPNLILVLKLKDSPRYEAYRHLFIFSDQILLNLLVTDDSTDYNLNYSEDIYINHFNLLQKLNFVNLYIFQAHNHRQQVH